MAEKPTALYLRRRLRYATDPVFVLNRFGTEGRMIRGEVRSKDNAKFGRVFY